MGVLCRGRGGRRGMQGLAIVGGLLSLVLAGATARAGRFEALRVRVPGEIRDLRAADLDGDGRKELVVVLNLHQDHWAVRRLRIYGWGTGGRGRPPPLLFRWEWEVAPEAVFWDVGPSGEGTGRRAVFYLCRHGIRELVPSGRGRLRSVGRIEAPVFLSRGQEDEFPWLDFLRDWNGDGREEIFLPLGEGAVFYGQGNAGGAWSPVDRAEIVPLPYYANDVLYGRKVGNCQYASFLFYPLLEDADLDGDGRRDLIALQDGKGRCFLRGPEGNLADRPFSWNLEIRSEEEKIRRRATLSYRVADLNGDRRADVVVHKVSVNLTQWSAETAVFLGRAGPGRPERPDQRFTSHGLLSGVSLDDLDGDGLPELSVWAIKMGLWPVVEILLRRTIHLEVAYYHASWPEGFSGEAAGRRTFAFRIDPSRPSFFRGVLPTTTGDFDGDGLRDVVAGRKDEGLAIYLGRPGKEGFASRPWTVLEARGVNFVRVDDLDGDGRTDLYGYSVAEDASHIRLWLQRGGDQEPGAPPPGEGD